MYAVGMTPTPESEVAVKTHVELVKRALEPWAASHMYLNFAETNRDGRTLWTEPAYRRLQRIKASVDPYDVIRSNHPITPR
jgi:Berberine and berberine like